MIFIDSDVGGCDWVEGVDEDLNIISYYHTFMHAVFFSFLPG